MDRDVAPREKLWEMIKQQRFAMMTTHHEGGSLRSRPMTTVERGSQEALWFFAAAGSEVVEDTRRQPQVCLSYGGDAEHFVSVSGRATLIEDAARKRELWNPMVQAWFPQGPDSAEVLLIEVRPEHAEYWDTQRNRLVQLFSMAEALASGVPPRGMGEHRQVDLHGRSPQ